MVIPEGAFFDGHGKLLGYNIAGSLATFAWSFVLKFIILFATNAIPGMRFRLDEDEKYAGSDIISMYKIACTAKLTPAASMSHVAAIGQASV